MIAAAGGWGPTRSRSPPRPRRHRQGKINTTDPDSRMVKGQHGWLQGYNAQAATNEHQIVIAAEIDGRLTRLRAPRADGRRRPPRARGRRRHRRARRWCSRTPATGTASRCTAIAADGIPVLIPPDSGLRKSPATGLERRPLRLHAQRPRDRAWRRALPATPTPDRDGVRLTPNTTAASIASTDAAEPPSAPNGA